MCSSDLDRTRLGVNARAYAERAFRIADIADRFEHVIADAVTGRGARPAR